MSRKDDQSCKRSGCTKGGFFHGYCKKHFPEAYGMSWEDYLGNRAFRGEKPHLVAARIKGVGMPTLTPGKAATIEGSLETTAPAITATAVVIPQDLWEKISGLAAIEFRTPDQQVLYMLDGLFLNPVSRTRIVDEVSERSLEARIISLISTSPAIRAAIKG